MLISKHMEGPYGIIQIATILIFLFLASQHPVRDNGLSLHLLIITILTLIQEAAKEQDFCKITAPFLSLFPSHV